MIINNYTTKKELISTPIAGGRVHFGYRQPVRALDTYEYELMYGENYHTLSAVIFGSDEFWWILDDINKPANAFGLKTSDKVQLPYSLSKDRYGLKKIF